MCLGLTASVGAGVASRSVCLLVHVLSSSTLWTKRPKSSSVCLFCIPHLSQRRFKSMAPITYFTLKILERIFFLPESFPHLVRPFARSSATTAHITLCSQLYVTGRECPQEGGHGSILQCC